LNGKTGTIIAWIENKARYSIHIISESKIVSLDPANVILNNGTVGKTVGLNTKTELNGKYGTIKSWVWESNQYDVQVLDSQVLRLKIENVLV
jgi:hypothetical protein